MFISCKPPACTFPFQPNKKATTPPSFLESRTFVAFFSKTFSSFPSLKRNAWASHIDTSFRLRDSTPG
ncbi:MAG: hypothetical protein C4530_13670 [Desulfobacteraceae bacterium]|nr:MAG: hypothetical protein C4530_13670 [Desulfobacteraceae bacterium]